MPKPYCYLDTHINSLSITQSLVHLRQQQPFTPHMHTVLLALRLAQPHLKSADLSTIHAFLEQIESEQIVSLVTQIKQQLTRMQVLKLQHEQDAVYVAYLKDQTQQLDVCIQTLWGDSMLLTLQLNSQLPQPTWQLKQSEAHLIATQEILTTLDPAQSPEHKVLAQSVEDAVDLWVTAKDPNDEHFWDYFPAISLVSVSLAIYELFKRYQQQEISWQEFKWMAAKVSGLKVSKIAAIGLMLGLPVIGQVTGAYLVTRLLLNAKATWFDQDSALYRDIQQKLKRQRQSKSSE